MDSEQNKVSEGAKPSILSLMIDKHEAIEQTVSLIKKELTQDMTSASGPGQQCSSATIKTPKPKSGKEFDGLTTLLEDSNFQSAIRVVAGNDTKAIFDKTLVALKSSESLGDKSKVVSEGLKKLQANLSQGDKSKLHSDPLFSLAMSLVGVRQDRKT